MTKQYRDQGWNQRFSSLGDESEGVYLTVRPLGPTTRYGLRRPEGVAVSKFPPPVAHTPDFITYQHWVEVGGLGRDGIYKSIKVEKWRALLVWQKIGKLLELPGGGMFFCWNSAKKVYALVTMKEMTKLVKRSVEEYGVASFEVDSVEYHPLPWEWILAAAVWSAPYEAT